MSCPLCNPSKTLWENELFYIIDASDDNFPIYWRVVAKRHIKEMTDLTLNEQAQLWSLLTHLESIMRDHIPNLAKVNWAQFGNVVPHLHWHLIARWSDDSYFPESPWGLMQRSVPAHIIEERHQLNLVIRNKLPELLDF